MAYVPVPKDFSKIKTKLALNLTKRQIICFSLAGICGVPVYLLTKAGVPPVYESGKTPQELVSAGLIQFDAMDGNILPHLA